MCFLCHFQVLDLIDDKDADAEPCADTFHAKLHGIKGGSFAVLPRVIRAHKLIHLLEENTAQRLQGPVFRAVQLKPDDLCHRQRNAAVPRVMNDLRVMPQNRLCRRCLTDTGDADHGKPLDFGVIPAEVVDGAAAVFLIQLCQGLRILLLQRISVFQSPHDAAFDAVEEAHVETARHVAVDDPLCHLHPCAVRFRAV